MASSSTAAQNDGYDEGDRRNDGLKDRILQILSSIRAKGSFASVRQLPHQPPAIHFNDIGYLKMPLEGDQIHSLIGNANKTTFGAPWELDASNLSLSDPQWPNFLTSICAMVSEDLGIDTAIAAIFSKMLIYETGPVAEPYFGCVLAINLLVTPN